MAMDKLPATKEEFLALEFEGAPVSEKLVERTGTTGEKIEVYGDGSAKRDFTYVEDILDGILKAIDHECEFEIFNLGESHTTDVKTLMVIFLGSFISLGL